LLTQLLTFVTNIRVVRACQWPTLSFLLGASSIDEEKKFHNLDARKAFSKPVVELCNGDYERKLKFDVFDWDSNGSHDYIGSFVTTLQELSIAVVEKKSFACINEAKSNCDIKRSVSATETMAK
jgi:hypothetical protein